MERGKEMTRILQQDVSVLKIVLDRSPFALMSAAAKL